MDNREIASVFSDIADILELKDDNVFRVRAYRRAAANVSGLSRQLSDIYKEDESAVFQLAGIGKDLGAKIIEMVETGHLEYYSRLMKEFPKGFLAMLDLGGLGPKKLKKLRDEFRVENVDDLERVCLSGKLSEIEGMGEKTQAKLLQEIARFRQHEGRVLADRANGIADELISYLKKSKIIKRIEKAGSLRRGVETVGDIDILVVSGDPEKTVERFVSFPDVSEVIAKGPTKASIRVRGACQIDLRIVEQDWFGAALVYFTGSKQHNVKIRHIAKRKGLKISEYGVFKTSGSRKEIPVAGKTEEDVYREIGMAWIPPELREDRGEIEAALKGELPRGLIGYDDIKGDLHLHTVDSDGRMTVEELIKGAIEKGYQYIAITNHSGLVKVASGLDEKKLLEHVEHIRKTAAKFKKIHVLAGVEVDLLKSGKLDMDDSVLRELDLVIAAIHSNFSLDKETQTRRLERAMDNKYVNMLAHPSGRLITKRSPLELDLDLIFRKAVENNIILEINTHGQRVDLSDVNCMRARDLGARFAISTDAHERRQMDNMSLGIATARRAWIKKKDVVNTYEYDRLIKVLKKKTA